MISVVATVLFWRSDTKWWMAFSSMNLHRFTGFASKSKLSNSGSGKKDPLRCWKKCWAIFLIGWNHMKTNLFKMWKWGKDVNLPCRMHNFESQFQFVCTKIGRFFFPEPDPFQYVHKFWRISPQNPISQMFFFSHFPALNPGTHEVIG